MPFAFSGLYRPPIVFWDPSEAKDANGREIQYGEGPLYAVNPWDTVTLNGNRMPGLCKVKASPTIKFDKKKSGGVDGLAITSQGYIPGPVEIEILLWTSEQWSVFQKFAGEIWTKPRRGGVSKAIDISHPGTDLWKIRSLVIESVSLPEDGPVPQSKIVRVKGVEFIPPNTTGKTKTIKASNAPTHHNLARPGEKNAGAPLLPPSQTDAGPKGKAAGT